MVVLTSFQMPETPVKYEQRNTRAVLDKKDLGLGTLYISERFVCWKEQGNTGFCLSYPHITLHAISSDANVYPRECIYIMIDSRVALPGESIELPQQADSDSEQESEADISELILVPGDPSALTPMYEALKECQGLNPDPEDMDDEENEIYEDADEEIEDQRNYPDLELGDIGAGGDTAFYAAHLRLARAGFSLRHLLQAHNVDIQNWQEFVENLNLNDFEVN